jgi:hypothetical protein
VDSWLVEDFEDKKLQQSDSRVSFALKVFIVPNYQKKMYFKAKFPFMGLFQHQSFFQNSSMKKITTK